MMSANACVGRDIGLAVGNEGDKRMSTHAASHERARPRPFAVVPSRPQTLADVSPAARAIRRCRTIAEAHVVGAYFALRSIGETVSRDALAWAISVELGDRVSASHVQRGLRDACANGTLRRRARGRYEPGPRLADLAGFAPVARPRARLRIP
jgi:hypothetical protein